ncbi:MULTISPECIES: adenine phosphoribosyltransferase [unclassified Gilliamella]|uniref:adenine phosphoribosyltransferase n=1 Tax=unclassified Gilliamella TaxID=2685620 RepID=UPI001C69E7CD|nr:MULTISPECIES: adenine phosphoribosyltransferase [unclassified Gilliamella]MCX8574914.1 adenine phosphoribosyltransferase [Gilliamella sp. B3831]MCX8577098.1 adenine phosphoribosyltransferase [Gilliamella sp. B3815]MCX8589640.1 adenine phosphoribosyltransferase [Gilliamella sp. B3812]MCX8604144.1 adenine phosphoribosyltransferase [Gilliamella sp. B3823]MCX8605534.1 adenine phosphoribosyltransferase [Gilliamella sp. B3825]
MTQLQEKLALIKNSIITIPDYPKQGILFRDITSLLEDPVAFRTSVELLIDHYRDKKIDKVVGTEARGFIFAAPIALALGVGFVPVRKPNKLPRHVFKEEYQLEYGTDTLEIHSDAIKPNERVLIIDDLLATGGTVAATAKLIQKAGGIAEDAAFVINLPDLHGKTKLTDLGINCFTLVDFAGE